MLGAARLVVLAADSPVFHRGDASDGLYCVLSGAIRFGAVASSGRESIVALVEGPEWFGEIALFDGGVRTHDAWADVTSTLLHLPLRHLTKILAEDPGAWRHLGALVVRKLRIALSLLEEVALEPPRVRLARCLSNLFEGYGQRRAEHSYRVRVSQENRGQVSERLSDDRLAEFYFPRERGLCFFWRHVAALNIEQAGRRPLTLPLGPIMGGQQDE